MVETGLLIAAGYLGVGLVVAVLFLLLGISRADHAANGAKWPFRLIVLPGLILLWPIILGRWLSGRQINQNIHAGDAS